MEDEDDKIDVDDLLSDILKTHETSKTTELVI
jgi:hypothetical protein